MISAESKGTILVVEDEPNLGITLKEYLETINYRAYLAQSISEAKKVFHDIAPQVVLMALGLSWQKNYAKEVPTFFFSSYLPKMILTQNLKHSKLVLKTT
jgi:CheY-like chemotaxis protein